MGLCRYHCSLFYTASELTEAWSWVLTGIALSQIIGGPLAGGELCMVTLTCSSPDSAACALLDPWICYPACLNMLASPGKCFR